MYNFYEYGPLNRPTFHVGHNEWLTIVGSHLLTFLDRLFWISFGHNKIINCDKIEIILCFLQKRVLNSRFVTETFMKTKQILTQMHFLFRLFSINFINLKFHFESMWDTGPVNKYLVSRCQKIMVGKGHKKYDVFFTRKTTYESNSLLLILRA